MKNKFFFSFVILIFVLFVFVLVFKLNFDDADENEDLRIRIYNQEVVGGQEVAIATLSGLDIKKENSIRASGKYV